MNDKLLNTVEEGKIKHTSGHKFVFAIQKEKDKRGNLLVRHLILTSYDNNRSESEKANPPPKKLKDARKYLTLM